RSHGAVAIADPPAYPTRRSSDLERVESVEFHPPARPRDLLWRRVHMVVHGGPDGEVFLPVLYAGSAADPNDQIRLGRTTEWRGGDRKSTRLNSSHLGISYAVFCS